MQDGVVADAELPPKHSLNAVIIGHLSPAFSGVPTSFSPNQQQLHFTKYRNYVLGAK